MGILDGLFGHGSDLSPQEVNDSLAGILTQGETVQVAFRVIRDLIVFTDRRLILVDKQGMTGRKVAYMTVPYRAITCFSVETAGGFDFDSELAIWVSGRPEPIRKTLKRGADILGIQQAIAASVR
ncbi:PH domain-containing protein [Methylobacterium sp. WL19]|uniref:PH domain-containing protein n=1 Tax=Methylobacterium sp. WL19 TaxID=2603896 RepID=UPI0011C7B47A|nr:PH domain-containing protein [Methylobacterium sp. WL19]TXN33746.1 PH domain-containing protein [Methylobacterium sp. WL19]